MHLHPARPALEPSQKLVQERNDHVSVNMSDFEFIHFWRLFNILLISFVISLEKMTLGYNCLRLSSRL